MTSINAQMTAPRRKMLDGLAKQPARFSEKYPPLKWAKVNGFVAPVSDGFYSITAAGRGALTDADTDPALKQARTVLRRRKAKALCRQASDTEEAMQRGGGYLYFTEPDHRPFPPAGGRLLIDAGDVTPLDDGLFAGMSQTFEVPCHA
jgi:hypothetical protein